MSAAGAVPAQTAVAAPDGLQSRIWTTVGPDATDDFQTDGTNDTGQINAAIQAVGDAGGGTVYIRAGTYNITGTIDNDRPGVLVRGDFVTHYPKVTYLKATAEFSPFARISAPAAGGFEDLYIDGAIDGENWVADGLIIGDPDAQAGAPKVKNPRVRNLRIEHFSNRGIGGIINGIYPSGSFDDVTFDDVRLAWCHIGVENTSTLTYFLGGVIGACQIGIAAMNASAATFVGTVWTTRGRDGSATNVDVRADKSTAAYSFNGCYFESATNSILTRSVPPAKGHNTLGFTFQSCAMRNLSKLNDPNFPAVDPSGYMLDLGQIGGTVALINCWYDTAQGSSDTINVGPESKVVVFGSGNRRNPTFVGNTAAVSSYREDFAAINTAAASNPLTVNAPLAEDQRAVALISSSEPSDKPLVVQGVGDQAARLTEWQGADGQPMAFVSNTGRMYAGGGTQSTPAFGNARDTDTGMYFPADGSVGWTLNGASAMRLDSAGLLLGNRSIGEVADPDAPQDVATKNYVDNRIQALQAALDAQR